MNAFTSCQSAIQYCLEQQSFSVARLDKEETTKGIHIHDCYELYYSISGGKQFLIDRRLYPITPGDLFLINQYESHKLSEIDVQTHERIVINLHPAYVKSLCTQETDLSVCFTIHPDGFNHRLSLSPEHQNFFLSVVDRICSAEGYGCDVLARAAITELLVFLNINMRDNCGRQPVFAEQDYRRIEEITAYINERIAEPITVEQLAGVFYLSPVHLCRIFKQATGTSIKKYVNARRISIAKDLLIDGASVTETYERAGFSDYSSFYKLFMKSVGTTPKHYALMNRTESAAGVPAGRRDI